jgi:hypothetical protein
MGFVYPNQADLFVSYARGDDEPVPGVETGWVTALLGALRSGLARKFGSADAFAMRWDDERASVAGSVAELRARVRGSAALVVVLSESYLASAWRQGELGAFLAEEVRQRQGGARLFMVEYDKVERPEELKELLGARFWENDPGTDRTRPLGFPRPDPADRRYWDRVWDLCHDLAAALKRQRGAAGALPRAAAPALACGGVAEAESARSLYDLAVVRAFVREALGDQELKDLCGDHFREVYDEFTDGQGLSARVQQLVDFAERRVRLDELVGHVRAVNQKVYEEFAVRLTRPDPCAGPAVYLAETTDDLEDEQAEVERYLKQHGQRLHPRRSLPADLVGFRQAAHTELRPCALFVQLLSERKGKALLGDDPDAFRGLTQYRCAADLAKPVLLWRHPAADLKKVTHEAHRGLLDGPDVMAVDLEEFKAAIFKRVQKLTAPPKESVKPAAACHVFVNTSADDRPMAEAISEVLARRGFWAVMPYEKGTVAQAREDLETNLRECDGLVMVFGRTEPYWVRSQLLQSRKILHQREKPLAALAICEGPPPKPRELLGDLRIPNLRILRWDGAAEPEGLEDFIKSVQPG